MSIQADIPNDPQPILEDNPIVNATEGQCDCACQSEGSQLSAWIHITDACNLNCSYCYLPHAPEHMSQTTGRSIIDSAIRSAQSHNYQALKLKYAGGEPLLRLDVLLELHNYALKVANQQHVSLSGVVLTNGTLLDRDNSARIHAAGLRLMVSLDGIGAYHDCQRHYKDGRGSFEQVRRGIEHALNAGLVPELSITVSGQSIGGLPDLMEWVLAHELPFSINFYRRNARSDHQGGLDLEEQAIINGMLAAFQVVQNHLPRHSLLAALVDRANLSAAHRYPCAAGRDYLVFNAAGQVSICQMQMDQTVSNFQAGDPLQDIQKLENGFANPPVDMKSDCLSCRWKYYCAGGCPLQAFQANGSYYTKSPNCHIYQALFPEVLRLELLRLAKLKETRELNNKNRARQVPPLLNQGQSPL